MKYCIANLLMMTIVRWINNNRIRCSVDMESSPMVKFRFTEGYEYKSRDHSGYLYHFGISRSVSQQCRLGDDWDVIENASTIAEAFNAFVVVFTGALGKRSLVVLRLTTAQAHVYVKLWHALLVQSHRYSNHDYVETIYNFK